MTLVRLFRSHGPSLAAATTLILLQSGCSLMGTAHYADDVDALRKHHQVIELGQGPGRIAVVPDLQGRVMTSGFAPDGVSLGWINREAVDAGERDVAFNNYGGQDRFWLGPEGGQFSLYFGQGMVQNFDTWRVGDDMHKGKFEVVDAGANHVRMTGRMKLKNASGTAFDVGIARDIRTVPPEEAARLLATTIPEGVACLGFLSENRIQNMGMAPWTPESGTVSIWIIGQFPGNAGTVVIAPFRPDGSGQEVESSYFGEPPPGRVVIDREKHVVLFKGDAACQSKIGLSAARATDRLGSIDFANRVLTIAHFDPSPGNDQYVNSMWKVPQEQPFAGDVVNSYNSHGRGNEDFYELESSSPAAFLAPGQSMTHVHRTLQFNGSLEALSQISERVLGVSLEHVRSQME